MKPDSKLVPQLVVEIGEGVADSIDRAFGPGSFEAWAERLRASGLAGAWGTDAPPPPVFVAFDEEIEDRLTTDEDRMHLESMAFDEDGVARAGRVAVRVVAVETGVEDIEVELRGWVSAVPDTGGGGE